MDVLLGVGVAAGFGFSDFLGGTAGRRTGPLRVIAGAQFTGAAIIGIYLLAASQPLGGVRVTVLATVAGAGLAFATACMYTGLSWGRMSVIAPVAATAMAVFTFAAGLVRGERPSTTALAGVALAIVAVILISQPPTRGARGGLRRRAGAAYRTGRRTGSLDRRGAPASPRSRPRSARSATPPVWHLCS